MNSRFKNVKNKNQFNKFYLNKEKLNVYILKLLLVLLFDQIFVVWVRKFPNFLVFQISFKALINNIGMER